MKYPPNESNTNHKLAAERQKRQSNIRWSNPPFSISTGTNKGKKFLKLLHVYFPPGHKLHKILNRNTIKISCSCALNMNQIIINHSQEIVTRNEIKDTEKKECNCRQGKTCTLGRKYFTSGAIYQATLTRKANDKHETFIGLTNNAFKTGFAADMPSFKSINRKNATTLSQYIWTMKEEAIEVNVEWKIIVRAKSHSLPTGRWCLYLKDKDFIIFQSHKASSKNINELATECKHKKTVFVLKSMNSFC